MYSSGSTCVQALLQLFLHIFCHRFCVFFSIAVVLSVVHVVKHESGYSQAKLLCLMGLAHHRDLHATWPYMSRAWHVHPKGLLYLWPEAYNQELYWRLVQEVGVAILIAIWTEAQIIWILAIRAPRSLITSDLRLWFGALQQWLTIWKQMLLKYIVLFQPSTWIKERSLPAHKNIKYAVRKREDGTKKVKRGLKRKVNQCRNKRGFERLLEVGVLTPPPPAVSEHFL